MTQSTVVHFEQLADFLSVGTAMPRGGAVDVNHKRRIAFRLPTETGLAPDEQAQRNAAGGPASRVVSLQPSELVGKLLPLILECSTFYRWVIELWKELPCTARRFAGR